MQQWGRSGKRNHRMKLNLPPKLVEKLVWVPLTSFCEIFIPSDSFHALICRNWPFSPPHRLTLLITIMCQFFGPAVSSTLCTGCPDFCLKLTPTKLCMYYMTCIGALKIIFVRLKQKLSVKYYQVSSSLSSGLSLSSALFKLSMKSLRDWTSPENTGQLCKL